MTQRQADAVLVSYQVEQRMATLEPVDNKFHCPLCDKVYKHKNSCVSHIVKKHPIQATTPGKILYWNNGGSSHPKPYRSAAKKLRGLMLPFVLEFKPDVIVVAELGGKAAANVLETNNYVLILPDADRKRRWTKRVCTVHVFVRKGLLADSHAFGERWHTVRVGNTRVCGVHLRHRKKRGAVEVKRKLSQYPAMIASLKGAPHVVIGDFNACRGDLKTRNPVHNPSGAPDKDNAFVSNIICDVKIASTALELVNQHSRIEMTLFVVDRNYVRLPTFRT